jgi:hypothetical protein
VLGVWNDAASAGEPPYLFIDRDGAASADQAAALAASAEVDAPGSGEPGGLAAGRCAGRDGAQGLDGRGGLHGCCIAANGAPCDDLDRCL